MQVLHSRLGATPVRRGFRLPGCDRGEDSPFGDDGTGPGRALGPARRRRSSGGAGRAALSKTEGVSNLENKPAELVCRSARGGIEVMVPREVPLGGPRAMTVRRTLPQRERSLIGAWCFLDHYGPDDVADTGGMRVPPHPHTGLQTASWLFTGEIEHRDSAGHHALGRPGELDLMTAGHGISHSEVSTAGQTLLHGAQLWVALPASARDVEPTFQHFAPAPVTG